VKKSYVKKCKKPKKAVKKKKKSCHAEVKAVTSDLSDCYDSLSDHSEEHWSEDDDSNY
jgi:hypothetical protein